MSSEIFPPFIQYTKTNSKSNALSSEIPQFHAHLNERMKPHAQAVVISHKSLHHIRSLIQEENNDIQSGRVHIIDRTTLAVSSWYYDPVSTHHSPTSCSNRVFRSVVKYYNPICPIAFLDLNENCIIPC
ncbi:hypothetical protein JTB14_020490 [Gonioctena quinquepunctata]|nr:hypothetical protein JTB14_020490 [Gonioctena quinquepunctata]